MSDELTDRFVRFLQAYARGESQAKTATTILGGLGMAPTENNRRTLRACAQDAVKAGHLVCSARTGYFVPESPEEVLASTDWLCSQASEMWGKAKRMRELAAEQFELQDEPEAEGPRPALFALIESATP